MTEADRVKIITALERQEKIPTEFPNFESLAKYLEQLQIPLGYLSFDNGSIFFGKNYIKPLANIDQETGKVRIYNNYMKGAEKIFIDTISSIMRKKLGAVNINKAVV